MKNEENQVEQPDYLNMTDEELLAAGPPEVTSTDLIDNSGEGQEDDDDQVQPNVNAGDDTDADADSDADADADADKDGTQGGEQEQAPSGQEAGAPEGGKPEGEAPTGKEGEQQPAPKEGEQQEQAPKSATVDYEAEYKKILKPFKANGHEIKVDSVEDAVALMQMGANYNKKMSALKPNLKLMKMLENSGFLNEENISYLIDLGKKDPAAISRLVQESGVDPMDLTNDKAKEYKPTTRTVSDTEFDLDTVLEDLKSSPTYNRTLRIVGNQWDANSKSEISKNPELLRVVNTHVELGIYDLIENKMVTERALGRLKGKSDIEAYRDVGDAMDKAGAFNHLIRKNAPELRQEPVIVAPVVTKPVDDKLKNQKRAASSPRPAAPSAGSQSFNPLDLSDEEFSKLKPQFT